jgi:glutaredoxin
MISSDRFFLLQPEKGCFIPRTLREITIEEPAIKEVVFEEGSELTRLRILITFHSESIYVPESVEVFSLKPRWSPNLRELLFHEGLKRIECDENWSGRPYVRIPKSVEFIDTGFFVGMRSVEVEAGHFRGDDGHVWHGDKLVHAGPKVLYVKRDIRVLEDYCSYCNHLERLIFEEGSQLTRIGISAFVENHPLRSVRIPKRVEILDDWCFRDSLELREVDFEEESEMRKFGNGVFSLCRQLEYVSVPKHVKAIGRYCFWRSDSSGEACAGEVDFAENSELETIGERAFDPLIRVQIPAGVITVLEPCTCGLCR